MTTTEVSTTTDDTKVPLDKDAHNRVKLYVLCDQRVWDDRGTGHVACLPCPDNSDTYCIIVRLEANEKNVLESRIHGETVYQKQQGTLIVWSESETCDLALSFQEKTGCTEIWDKICRIQGKDPEAEVFLYTKHIFFLQEECENDEQDPSDSSVSGISANISMSIVTLPECTLKNLNDIEAIISNNMFQTSQREKMATAIQHNGYLQKFCEIFHTCETKLLEETNNEEKTREFTKALNLLYSIAKNMFLLNCNSLLNDLLDDKNFK